MAYRKLTQTVSVDPRQLSQKPPDKTHHHSRHRPCHLRNTLGHRSSHRRPSCCRCCLVHTSWVARYYRHLMQYKFQKFHHIFTKDDPKLWANYRLEQQVLLQRRPPHPCCSCPTGSGQNPRSTRAHLRTSTCIFTLETKPTCTASILYSINFLTIVVIIGACCVLFSAVGERERTPAKAMTSGALRCLWRSSTYSAPSAALPPVVEHDASPGAPVSMGVSVTQRLTSATPTAAVVIPVGHAVHTSIPDAPFTGLNVPIGQAVQAPASAGTLSPVALLYVPAGHSIHWHTESAPSHFLNCPAPHSGMTSGKSAQSASSVPSSQYIGTSQ